MSDTSPVEPIGRHVVPPIDRKGEESDGMGARITCGVLPTLAGGIVMNVYGRSRSSHIAYSILGVLLLFPMSVAARSPLSDSLDVRISEAQEVESSVFVSPLHPDVVFVGNNGLRTSVSLDGGQTWVNTFIIDNGFDPAVVISANPAFGDSGRFVVNYLRTPPDKTLFITFKDAPHDSFSTPHTKR